MYTARYQSDKDNKEKVVLKTKKKLNVKRKDNNKKENIPKKEKNILTREKEKIYYVDIKQYQKMKYS